MDKGKIRSVCAGGLLAALYIVTTAINPIGYGMLQLRVSAIISLIPFFRKEYKLPCIMAVAIANLFSPLGMIDVAVGIVLWTLAYYVIDPLCGNLYVKCAATAVLSGALIGWELAVVLGAPFRINLVSVTVSQAVVFGIGVICLKRLFRVQGA